MSYENNSRFTGSCFDPPQLFGEPLSFLVMFFCHEGTLKVTAMRTGFGVIIWVVQCDRSWLSSKIKTSDALRLRLLIFQFFLLFFLYMNMNGIQFKDIGSQFRGFCFNTSRDILIGVQKVKLSFIVFLLRSKDNCFTPNR